MANPGMGAVLLLSMDSIRLGALQFLGLDLAREVDVLRLEDPAYAMPALAPIVARPHLGLLAPSISTADLVRYRRSRGAPAKPRRKPNRLHVSKRVRRKHRRAA